MALAAVAGCLAALGCGYHFTAAGAGFPQGIQHVFAPVIVNRTTEPGLEGVFTEALREQLARSGHQGGESSEGRLEGELLAVGAGVAQLAPGTSGALTYRVSATLRVRLFRGGTLLAQTDVTGTEDYLPALRADVLTTEANRQAALRRLASALAADAVARLQTG
ncbi:MAG TPA: LPS assembly lipoprotein LptE [Myxococcaceae bacterium]|nr:LPS assembly lipoprotein LptE [Myxococcaceae bacterium]